MVDVWLPYNRTEVHVRIPSENFVEVVEVHEKPGTRDASREIEKAIEGLFSEKIEGGKVTLALNIPDTTLAKLIVNSVMREMMRIGLKNGDLTVVLANNPLTLRSAVIEQLKGEIASPEVSVSVHDPVHNNLYVGDLEGGVKVYLNRAFAEADIRIVASIVEPDPYIMYNCCETGVSLGLTGLETIRDNLIPILSAENIQERIFERAVNISRLVRVDYSIGIVRNLGGEIVACFSGRPDIVMQESLSTVDSLYKVTLKEKSNVVIISPGGSPFDTDIFGACRCLENALKAVGRDGIIILVAECSGGYGEIKFHQAIKRANGNLNLLEQALKDNFSVSGFIAYRFLRAFKKAEIIMATAAPDYYSREIPGLKIYRTVNEALNYALNKIGSKAKVIAIPHGNLIIPVTKSEAF
ncbi:MAG: lactate racemase domain-containing protein [Candidatus Bathyarchaeia archaeon]